MLTPGSGLRVGLLGSGDISAVYLRNIPRFPGLELVACAGRNERTVAAAAQAHGIAAMSVPQMLASPEVDLVVNLTPPAVHAELSRAALQAGKHVYSEKPLAATCAEAAALLALARSQRRVLACAPDTHLGPAGRLARAMIAGGEIGPVLSGSATFMSRGMEHRHPNPFFFYRAGGGPLHDIGPYYLTMLVTLLGPVDAVQATAFSGLGARRVSAPGPNQGRPIPVEVATTVQALLGFRSGAQITLSLSWDICNHGQPHLELHGTTGSLRLPDPDRFAGPLALARTRGDWQLIDSAPRPFGQPNWRSRPEAEPWANYRGLGVADLAAHVLSGTPLRCPAEQAVHLLEVMEAIERAADTGHRQLLKTSFRAPPPLPEHVASEIAERFRQNVE